MYAKEYRETRWVLLAGAAVAAVFAIGLVMFYQFVSQLLGSFDTSQLPYLFQAQVGMVATRELYTWSQWFGGKTGGQIVSLVALALGAGTIASEVSKNTIFFLLSKPISRTKVLLAKYAVRAAILLVVMAVGSVFLLVSNLAAGVSLNLGGLAISTIMIWLGGLFVLGVATLLSVVFNDVMRPAAITLAIAVLVGIPANFPGWEPWALSGYWANVDAFLGHSFPFLPFAVDIVAAVVPLAIAVALFRRKAY